jgi:hypothetical protein
MIVFRIVLIFVFGFCIFTSVAHAEPYDMTNCMAGETTMLVASKELVVFSYDFKGIVQDNLDTKTFANMSFQCIGISKIVAGKPTGQGICKFMDKDGDFIVGETTSAGPEGTWKAFYGTGKWKGITGSGKQMYITNSKPIVNGTFQNCSRATGTYELPE